MATQNDNLIARDEHSSLSLNRQREFDKQDCPTIICHIILLDRVNPSIAFIASKHIYIAVFKNDCRHSASLLIELGNALPPVQIDGVPFTAVEDSIDGAAANSINIVSLVGQSVRIPALEQGTLLVG